MNIETENNEFFDALATSFTALYMVDLDTGAYQNYVARESIADLTSQFEKYPNFEDLVRFYCESGMVHPDDREVLAKFYPNNATIKAVLGDRRRISMVFRRKYPDGFRWTKANILKSGSVMDEPHKVLIAFNECDDEVRSEEALKGSLTILQKNLDPDAAIKELLTHTGEFYGADRAYIFEYGKTRATICNTYEWCRDGIEPMISKLQDVPSEQVAGWFREFEQHGAFYMDALDSTHNTDDTRRTLEMQGIKWLVAAPILQDGEIVGFIGVDNPTRSKREIRLLKAVSTVAYAEILKRREGDEQHVTLGKLSDTFLSVYYVDLSRDYIRTWKIVDEYLDAYGAITSYSEAMLGYMKTGIVEADRERCTEMASPEYVRREFATKDRYSIETTDVLLGYERSIVFDFIKVSGDGNCFVACCRDVSETVRRQRAHQKALVEALEAVRVESAKNKTLSDITKRLYGYNISVDLTDGSFTLIDGTGAEDALRVMKGSRDYRDLVDRMLERICPEFHDRLRDLVSFDYLRINRGKSNFQGTAIYETTGARWGEVTVTYGTDEKGHPVANVLGRDITEQHRETARHEREMKAAVAKDQILSGITTTLYGFNITVNLAQDTFTLIKGTGIERFCEIFERHLGRPYSEVTDYLLAGIPEESRNDAYPMVSRDFLMEHRGKSGHFGTRTMLWIDDAGRRRWIEVHGFMAENGIGEPIVNLLGRDVTEVHDAQEIHEREQRAAMAKDQIISGITMSLYAYNLTVNLETLEISVIRGTGADCTVNAFEKMKSYDEILKTNPSNVGEEHFNRLMEFCSVEALREKAASGFRGFAGRAEYPTYCPIHGKHWRRLNLLIGEDENKVPTAHLLARDITEEHEHMLREQREHEAVVAKDRIMSEITKSIYGYNLTINLNTMKFTVILGTGMDKASEIFNNTDDFNEAFRSKMPYIVPADREKIAALLSPDALREYGRRGVIGPVGGMTYEAEIDGQHQWHETNVFIGTDSNGERIANVLGRNVTEQHTRADAEAKLKVAEAASKAKSEFLFNVSHDVRTPMHAIMGFADIALQNPGDAENVKDCLGKIKKSGDLMFSLLNSVLDVSRLEVGKAKIVEKPGDVMYSFESVRETMSDIAKEKNISITFGFGEIRDRFVYADYEKSSRIFMNILSNAIKYTKEGGWVRVNCTQLTNEECGMKNEECRNVHRSSSGVVWFRYTFEDNGIGMAPEFVEKLYDRFAREKNTTMGGVAGIGLGMSICKAFVDIMGGTIECRSQKGEGTTFTVTLPFRVQPQGQRRYLDPETGREMEAVEKAAPAGSDGKSANGKPFVGRRVLLVDDSKMNLVVACHYLKSFGFESETADDGTVAVGQIAKHDPGYFDLVLMDIQMPIMDGFEATRQIRRWENEVRQRQPDYRPIPIIAWSANAFEEDREKSIASGMNDHVAKGIKPAQLLETIKRYVK